MKAENITMLVTVKTYLTISSKYNETVCTAGITKDGLFKRIYPICYRSLPIEQRFKKYQWISCKAIRDFRDPRKESYKLVSDIGLLILLLPNNNGYIVVLQFCQMYNMICKKLLISLIIQHNGSPYLYLNRLI